ncbi:MAG: hypothetical protein U9R42_07780 [Bacteroidota bacterium]|nr:hypothetical protein [Bacteroidota bacterium]
MKKYILWITVLTFIAFNINAKENISNIKKKKNTVPILRLSAGCDPASASSNLDINNVRARIMNGGDMWWDLVGTAMYEIPKVTEEGESRKTSLFAGALWIGGYDDGDNLRAAAMTYRQGSSWDFFPGPLSTTDATISKSECVKWDKIFQITRDEIDEFIETSEPTEAIEEWPARSLITGESRNLAPFVDLNGNGYYDYNEGEYPDVLGDQTLWFVYNDKGNTHTETEALSIGLEIQTQAFAFATNDEINNMTFYQQKIINRSKSKLNKVYFGQWADPDLGYAYDDFVGCDSTRSLGICYNGDDFDEGVMGYGANPPSIGIDFFQGPLADLNDGIDNDKDGTIDEPGEEIIMSKFIYYENDWSLKGNPSEGIDFYYYLEGKFKNGQKMRYGGDGFNNVWDIDRNVNYMFPDDPRSPNGWSEVTAGNIPFDRRFLQSAGPFTLKPGAVNYITVGVVWARATTGGNTGSYDLLIIADDKAQKLYNNDFYILDGPDAPDITIQELNRELIISFSNTKPIEKYYDGIVSETGDSVHYQFQGYQIFQLKDAKVTTGELDNPDKARLIARVDIKDGITQLVNREYVPGLGIVPTEKVDINGDQGIKHTYSITSDAFSSGDAELINFRAYYYLVMAYANCLDANQYEQYLAGRKNIKIYTGIPHSNDIEFDGTELGSSYGDGPEITRIEGSGNGGQILELTDNSVEEILENSYIANPVYKKGNGPINIYVYDPLKVPNAEFEVKFIDSLIGNDPDNFTNISSNARWLITKTTSPEESVQSDTIYAVDYEQVFPQWGLAAHFEKVVGPNIDTTTETEGFIEATIEFEDISVQWLSGIFDNDPTKDKDVAWPYNWIRSGKLQVGSSYEKAVDDYKDGSTYIDPNEIFETMLNGRIAPYCLVARDGVDGKGYLTFGPAFSSSKGKDFQLTRLQSVDLVFTDKGATNKKYWTQCIVIETSEDKNLSEKGVEKLILRDHKSWTGEIDKSGNPIYSSSERGRSWFPGYAINLETGERMNIIFGEDSYFKDQNGADMIWNPTYYSLNPAASHREIDKYPWGGKHHIYLMDSKAGYPFFDYSSTYDKGKAYLDFFKDENYNPGISDQLYFWSQCMYVMMPMAAYPHKLKSLEEGLIPTETKIRIRIEKPYSTYKTSDNPENNNIPFYKFSTAKIAMTNSEEIGEDAMEKINIVPNPYYAFSGYEKNQLDNRVRIINLPRKCNVYIYTLSGALVRKFEKDESTENHKTFIDWDIKNHVGIPVASGLYIIHIDGFELGTKTLKWFGIMRPIDLDTF